MALQNVREWVACRGFGKHVFPPGCPRLGGVTATVPVHWGEVEPLVFTVIQTGIEGEIIATC